MPSSDPTPILVEIVQRWLEDRREGRVHDAAHYQALFPEFAEAIAAEIAELESADATADDVPRRLGPWLLERVLGRGGQGTVWLARDSRLDRRVALKVLDRWETASPRTLERFRREAEVVARLDHPSIAAVLGTGFDDGHPWIAMRHVTGRPLGELWREEGAPRDASALKERLELVRRLALAVQAAHDAGVVHRDLKPENVLVTPEGAPVILDFGLAHEDSGAASLTRSGDVMGTPAYMAPEQVRGERGDARTDVHALGALLFEGLAGRRPFTGDTRERLFHEILALDAPDLTRLGVARPDVAAIVRTALEKAPDRRYASAAALAADLAGALDGSGVSVRPLGPAGRIGRYVRRHPGRAGALSATAVLLLGLAGLTGFLAARWSDLELGARTSERMAVERALNAAFQAHGEGSTAEARRRFEELLAAHPDLVEAHVGLVLALRKAHRPEAATRHLETTFPPSPLRDRLLAAGAESAGAAEAWLQAAADLPPETIAIGHFVLALMDIERGHAGEGGAYASALTHLEEAARYAPSRRALFHHQRLHALAHLDAREAIARSRVHLETCWPDSAESWYWIAFATPDGADHAEERVRLLERALALRPDFPSAWTNYGHALLESGRSEDALAAYRRTLELAPGDPDYAGAYGGLVRAHLSLEQDEAARAAAEEGLRVAPESPELLALRAARAFDEGRIDAARADLRRAAEKAPHLPVVGLIRARVAHADGNLDEALEIIEEVVAEAPHQVPARKLHGTLLLAKGRPAEAAEAFARALEAAPKDETAVYNHALALDRIDRRAEALTRLERALEEGPATPRIALLRTNLLVRSERADEAVTAWGEALGRWPEDPDLPQAARTLRERAPERIHDILRTLDAACAAAPESGGAWLIRAILSFPEQEIARGLACARKAFALAPEDPKARLALCMGLVLGLRFEEYPRAIEMLEAPQPAATAGVARNLLPLARQLREGKERLDALMADPAAEVSAEEVSDLLFLATGLENHAAVLRLLGPREEELEFARRLTFAAAAEARSRELAEKAPEAAARWRAVARGQGRPLLEAIREAPPESGRKRFVDLVDRLGSPLRIGLEGADRALFEELRTRFVVEDVGG